MTAHKTFNKSIPIIIWVIVVLFAFTVFFVSFAAWYGSDENSVAVQGSVASYYVEFSDSSVGESHESGSYLVGTMNGWLTIDEYKMTTNEGNTNEVMIQGVALAAGTQLQIANRYDVYSVAYVAAWGDMKKYSPIYSEEYFVYKNGGNMIVNKTGLFDFYYGSTIWVEYKGDASVTDNAQALRTAQVAEDTTAYSTYVCVSRMSDTSSVAYLDFDFSAESEYADVSITSISVERRATDENGDIIEGGGYTPVTLNNFESKTLSECALVNSTQRPYIILNFGTGENRYYAMNVTVTTDKAARFAMTVLGYSYDPHNPFVPGSGEPNTFYLGGEINGASFWDPRPNSKMISDYTSDDGYVDAYIEMDITAGSRIKMYYVGDNGLRTQTGYYVPKQIIKVPSTIDAAIAGGDASCYIKTTGKYRIRYHGETSVYNDYNQYVEYLELTLLTTDAEDVDVDEGYYAVGDFSEEKILAEFKMAESSDYYGIYTLPYANASEQSFYVAHVDADKNVAYSALAVADAGSAVLYYDAYKNAALQHAFDGKRFSMNIDRVGSFATDAITLSYRSSMTSVDKATARVKQAHFDNDTYFADLEDVELASVSVDITYGSKRADSFDIDKYTLGVDDYFADGKSFRITANRPTVDGNWTGSIAKLSNGAESAEKGFSLVNDGYAVVKGDGISSIAASKAFSFTADKNSGDIAFGEKFMIYRNGKAVHGLAEANARVRCENDGYMYEIVDGAKSRGSYMVAMYTSDISIRYLGNASELGSVVGERDADGDWVNTDATLEGYYIVGQFTDWTVYANNKMDETTIDGYHTKVVDEKYVITEADVQSGNYSATDTYKVVYVPANGKFVWCGNDNQNVKTNSFGYDAYSEAYEIIDINSIVRIVFDATDLPVGYKTFINPKLHYWLDLPGGEQIGTDWVLTRPDMQQSKFNDNLYYYDVLYDRGADALTGGDKIGKEGISGIVIQTASTRQSVDITIAQCKKGATYLITATDGELGGKWLYALTSTL